MPQEISRSENSINCPTCGTACPPKALICKSCISPLHDLGQDVNTTAVVMRPQLGQEDLDLWQQPRKARFKEGATLYLSVERVNKPITRRLAADEAFVIGREDTGGLFETPDINLSPYDASNRGVSRQHLRIFLDQDGALYAEDLDSSNGTTVNGEHLPAHTPIRLRDSDELILGRMMLWVNF